MFEGQPPQIKAFFWTKNKGHFSSGHINDTIVLVFQLPYKANEKVCQESSNT